MRTTVHQITVLATTIALVALAGPPAIAAGLSSPGPPGSDQASATGDSRAPQATGGPEEFGYTWDDSDAFALIEELGPPAASPPAAELATTARRILLPGSRWRSSW